MRKTLVMIPAFGCDAGLYRAIETALTGMADLQTVIADGRHFDAMVAGVLAKAPEKFIILGTSMGGRLALEVALAAPGRVQGLVVIGAGAGGVVDPAAGLLRSARIRGGEKETVLREMGDMTSHLPGPKGPATRQAFVAMGSTMDVERLARQSDALAHRIDRWPRLAEITCPTLCLWGDHDQFSPAADGKRLAQGVQRGRYVEIKDCGHFPTLEYPAEAAMLISRWLQDEVQFENQAALA